MALGLTLQKLSFNSEFQLLYTANPVTKFLPPTPPRNKAKMDVEIYTVNSWEAEARGFLSSRSDGGYPVRTCLKRENEIEREGERDRTRENNSLLLNSASST